MWRPRSLVVGVRNPTIPTVQARGRFLVSVLRLSCRVSPLPPQTFGGSRRSSSSLKSSCRLFQWRTPGRSNSIDSLFRRIGASVDQEIATVTFRAAARLTAVSLLMLVPLLSCGPRSTADGASSSCGWSVLGSRPRIAKDTPFENRYPLLKEPDDPNRVKGPGNLVAIVKSDSLHHPQIYIEDWATGKRTHLLRGSKPKWSPDGTRIACEVWKSVKRPWVLSVVDVKTGEALEPNIGCLIDTYRWSPDGRSIAVGGTLEGKPVNVLCWVWLSTGTSRMLDTLPVFSAYEDLAWSPESRALVVARPTAVNAEEEDTAADLWLFDGEGRRCALTKTPGVVEESPRWLDGGNILYSFHRFSGGVAGPTELEVLLLKESATK
jgi:hypothetical protein